MGEGTVTVRAKTVARPGFVRGGGCGDGRPEGRTAPPRVVLGRCVPRARKARRRRRAHKVGEIPQCVSQWVPQKVPQWIPQKVPQGHATVWRRCVWPWLWKRQWQRQRQRGRDPSARCRPLHRLRPLAEVAEFAAARDAATRASQKFLSSSTCERRACAFCLWVGGVVGRVASAGRRAARPFHHQAAHRG